MIIGMARIKDLLDGALEALRRAGAGQGHAEYVGGSIALTRFAENRIHQNVSEEGGRVNLVAAVGRRLGAATTNRIDAEGFSNAASRAVALASSRGDDCEFPGFVKWPPAVQLPEAYDAQTAQMAPETRAAIIGRAAAYAAERGVAAYGAVKTGGGEIAIANSAGTFQYFAVSAISASCTAMISGAAGSEEHGARACAMIDAPLAQFGSQAVDTALKARDPEKVSIGQWPVVLSPRAVAELLRFLGWLGFNARAHLEGRSCLCGKMGRRVMSDLVTVLDDGLSLEGQPLPFDFEGAPRSRLTLIEKGIPMELAHDSRTAARAGVQTTGHSYGPMNFGGASPQHLVMLPGDATLQDMITSTKRGLFVSRFWYTNVAEPSRCILTGMTRDGLFLIEDGVIARPVRNMRFTESVLDAFDRVEMVGDTISNAGEEWGNGLTRCPALKISAFSFTGETEF